MIGAVKSQMKPMPRFLLLLALLAAGCQPLPHPFADDRPPARSPILSPRDSAGVIVMPVSGAPTPITEDLAEAMAEALRRAEIPASTRGHGKGSYRLVATAQDHPLGDGRSAIAIDWELDDAEGHTLGHVDAASEQPTTAWYAGGAAAATDIVAKTAPAIARLLQDEPPTIASGTDPVVAVRPVAGAPGDGDRSLTRAMGYVLGRAGIAIAERSDGSATFLLTCTVAMSPAQSGKQQVQIIWTLSRPNGSEIGKINQENDVPAGSLDGSWGDIAFAVAEAAAPGVSALITRAKAAEVGS
jgi:hypothetical protein